MDSPSTDSVSPRHPLAVLRFLGLVLLGSVVGGVAALVAVGFVNAVVWLNDLLLISPRGQMMAADTSLVILATLLVPTLGGLLVGQLHRGLPGGRPHTPADAIAAVQTRRGRLPAQAGALSALSGLVSLGAGASVGQYGPLVHLGATLGSLITRLLRLGRSEDNITIACGVAAAIAAAFNAPLAGIVFAHEVVLRHYALRAFAPVASAAIVGYVLATQLLAQGTLFHITEPGVPQPWEFALFLALGGLGALVAGGYMHAILAMGQLAKRLPLPTSLHPALAGALLGLTALWVPDILGMGQETLRFATLPGAYSGGELLMVLLLKLAATALCLGLGFAGGVFSPALVIGTLFGALAGTLVAELGGGQETFIFYAVCGMVAVTAPVLGAPLTTLLIVFELTGSYALTTAALASVTLANPLAAQLFGRSLFDIQLARRGLDLSAGRSRAVLQEARLTELISHDAVTLAPATPLKAAISRLSQAGHGEAYLVDDRGRYQGCVTLAGLETLREGSEATTLADCPETPRPVLEPHASLWEAMQQLQKVTGEAIAVVDDERRFLGVAYESSIARAFLHHSDALRREEHGAG
ncbi:MULTISPECIES: chloride channel protein [Halomonadaceae]|uniref:chloride channel protein n=1 Tax=Halomonadaceae TaxID=28256 RepID=UPI0012F388D4|nr:MULTISPECIES: chloride channel protein [Halomonas]CAD5249801.1 Chloride channel protein [Halomonas sp. I3]CAD5272296.1 Chloride channel protein [Halomonas sp. 113]CAD5274058.1 Chloride channel protein [Halomonas sp. 59]CAD5279546.1 Chloride channel protein [Halomonas sp. 156]VXB87310.1 Chloride channel protein [Halomonas titanicae]